MKIQLLLIVALLVGCSKEQGYSIKKYSYKVSGGGFNCDAVLKVDGKTINLNDISEYKFDSHKSFEVTFTPTRSNYHYELYVERNNTMHQQEKHDSYLDGVHGTRTYIIK